jgi:hypothetical protein
MKQAASHLQESSAHYAAGQTPPCHPRRACFYRGVIFLLNSRLTLLPGN